MKRIIGRHKDGKQWISAKINDYEIKSFIKIFGEGYEFVEVGSISYFVSCNFSPKFAYQFGNEIK